MNVELENIHFIRNIELCSLLGNLLDNCIEATQCCDKNKSITFCCNTTQNHFCIHASNTYNKKLKYKNGSFITTKKDSSMHGFGSKGSFPNITGMSLFLPTLKNSL